MWDFITGKHFGDWLIDIYNKYDERYFGIYQYLQPTLLIKDLDLVKQIVIKDFDTFVDHKNFFTESQEPVFKDNIFSLKGEKWRHMRATLSPAFTSSKMRIMFKLMNDCAEQFTDYIHNNSNADQVTVLNMKDIYSRYGNDIIATCGFGVICNSVQDRNNEFFLRGQDVTNFGGVRGIKFLFYSALPALMNFIKVRLYSEDLVNFFRNLVVTTIDSREKGNIYRPDMIHLLMEARKGKLKYEESTNDSHDAGFATVEESKYGKNSFAAQNNISDDELAAQVLIFFLAGFETSSSTLSFLSYELAINEDIQRRLQKEIDEYMLSYKGEISYDGVLKLKYLDMVLTGEKWRHMRATLSPAFTSSKMRIMFKLMNDCAEQFTDYIHNNSNADQVTVLNMKDIYSRYGNDIIATCGFGVICNSVQDRNNEFFLRGQDVTNFGGVRGIKFLFYSALPALMNFIKVRLYSEDLVNFFRNLVVTTIDSREKGNIYRPDMIHLLMEARKGKLKYEESTNDSHDAGFATVEESKYGKNSFAAQNNISDDELAAQVLIFFLAGFETSSSTLSFLSYELAINEDIQRRLQKEIDEYMLSYKGEISYDGVLKLKYLDMVLTETLRLWSPVFFIHRICSKPYTIPAVKSGEKTITLKENDVVWIPSYAIHRDPNYYPNPGKFDLERFNEENKKNINPYSFMPFGIGPRNCIGYRFALLEIKVVIVHLVSKFDLVVVNKTSIPRKINKAFRLNTVDGINLGIKSRKK